MLFFLILAQAATAAPPLLPGHAAPFEEPKEAVRKGWSGTVRVELTISPEGRVTACKILQSSGHALLDDYTCSNLLRTAQFTPARDQGGKPVEAHAVMPPITYRIAG